MNFGARVILTALSVTSLAPSLPTFADHVHPSGSSSQSRSMTVNYRPSSGRGSSSFSRSNRSTQNGFSRGSLPPNTPNSGANPSHFNHNTSPQNFSRNSNNKAWKKYAGWGKWNHSWHHGIGWGWGCWFDPQGRRIKTAS